MDDYYRLRMSSEDVLKLSFETRILRLNELLNESQEILESSINKHIIEENKKLSNVCVLFSGGNDSTTLLHIMKDKADVVLHANTGIGISETTEFVKNTCSLFNMKLRIYQPSEKNTYHNIVKNLGFPGPANHYIMYHKLKEDPLLKARGEFGKRGHRLVFLSGRRRDESARRANLDSSRVYKNIVWVSPIINWTKADLTLYRKLNPSIPRNQVSDLIHMSGECLCGSFAHKGEREEIRMFFPHVIDQIEKLEKELVDMGKHKPERCVWGWGAYRKNKPNKKVGELCSSCETTQFETESSCIKVVFDE